MQRTSFDHMTCSIARTLDVFGEWWTPLILRDVFVGVTRFDTLQEDLQISRKVLTQRLAALVEHGVLERVAYQDNPVRYEYVPTEKGAELAPILLAMQAWGDRWLFGDGEAPVRLHHDRCGADGHAVGACSECGEVLEPHEISLLPGRGLLERADEPEAARAMERLERREALR